MFADNKWHVLQGYAHSDATLCILEIHFQGKAVGCAQQVCSLDQPETAQVVCALPSLLCAVTATYTSCGDVYIAPMGTYSYAHSVNTLLCTRYSCLGLTLMPGCRQPTHYTHTHTRISKPTYANSSHLIEQGGCTARLLTVRI
jgi:hypothetical protein